MSSIRARDTKPELLLRRGLHRRGLRYRLHARELPGRPDIVFPGRRAAVLVHGCFWHGHDCPLFVVPASNRDFWRAKIEGNRTRDARTSLALAELGWRTLTIWECALKGRARHPADAVLDAAAAWVRQGGASVEVGGRWPAREDGSFPSGTLPKGIPGLDPSGPSGPG